ncbi:hypothetical protein PM082_022458 [Marasmius tenuissimus]|nr:hypothetical protein PM082_022458 [Marasmius tenuissimus]
MLPIELWESIIEQCQDERPTLFACSLVCRSWTPKSRRLLFENRFLGCTDLLSRLNEDPKCTLASSITALRVGYPTTMPLDEFGRTIIDRFPSLTSLYVYSPQVVLPLLLNLSSSLTYLAISCRLPFSDDKASIFAGKLLKLIGNFNALEILSFYRSTGARRLTVDPISPPDNSKPLLSALSRLRRFEADLEWNIFLPWFLIPSASPFRHLETLQLKLDVYYFSGRVPLFQLFCNLCSSAVKHLSISFGWRVLPALDLGHFVCLRSIRFTDLGTESEPHQPHQLQRLIDIVSTCPSRSATSPLRVVLITDKKLDPFAIQGVEWIVKERITIIVPASSQRR